MKKLLLLLSLAAPISMQASENDNVDDEIVTLLNNDALNEVLTFDGENTFATGDNIFDFDAEKAQAEAMPENSEAEAEAAFNDEEKGSQKRARTDDEHTSSKKSRK